MKHEVTVEMTVLTTFVIDDTKVSDWDGRDLMHVHENGERWASGAPVDRNLALAVMGAHIIDRGRLGGTDGWADFADDAVVAIRWPDFLVNEAFVDVTEVES